MQNINSRDLQSKQKVVQSLDENGIILDISPAWLSTIGYKREDVIGQFFGNFLSKESIPQVEKNFPHLKDYGFVHNVSLVIIRSDNVKIQAILNGSSIYNSDGVFVQTFCELRTLDFYMNSMKELEELLERERFLKTINGVKANIATLYTQKLEANSFIKNVIQILEEPVEILQIDISTNIAIQGDFIALEVSEINDKEVHKKTTHIIYIKLFDPYSKQKNLLFKIQLNITQNTWLLWQDSLKNIANLIEVGLKNIYELEEKEKLLIELTTYSNKYQELQKQLELSANIAGLVFWELDLQTNQYTFNDLYYSYLDTTAQAEGGYTMDAQYFMDTFIPHDEHHIILNTISAGHKKDSNYFGYLEHSTIRRDGKILHVMVSYFAVYEDGKLIKAYGTDYDLTEQKKKQEELILAKEKADQANKAKSNFLANMSHEIRTPLNGIIGLTNLALEGELNSLQREYLNKSINSSEALLKIINEILDYSKIEANKVDIEEIPFELERIFLELSDLFLYKAKENKIKLYFNIAPTISCNLQGDPFKIKQILTNLLGNALKFTQKGEINLTVTLEENNQNNSKLSFRIKDTGIGISKEKQENLFKPFSQVDTSNTREYGGTGLGLIISKQLVELMGGTIGLESQEGKGSEFYFTLTLNHSQKEDSIPINKQHFKKIELKKEKLTITGKVLLVEDNKINQIVAKENLIKYGLEVVIAENGKIAVEKAKNEKFDLIFMDLQMPIMDGFEATKRIRAFNQNIPIIALSAAVMKSDKLLTQEVGMNEHLDKPINLNELQKILQKYLNQNLSIDIKTSHIKQETIKGINMQELIKRINGNTQLAYELLLNFADNQQDIVTKLDSLDYNSKEFSSFIHNLKGVSGNLSMSNIHKYTTKIYLNKDFKLLPNLKKELQTIIDTIHLKLERKIEKKLNEKFSKADLIQTLTLFIRKLNSDSFIQNNQIDDLLTKLRGDVEDKEILIILENALKQFEYKYAKEILEKIKTEL